MISAVRPGATRGHTVRERPARVALAMAGGGPLGAIYEIGALTALSESLGGVDLNRLDIYVGVSAGGILGAGLANGITPREMCRLFIDPIPGADHPVNAAFDPSRLMLPAVGEYWSSMQRLPPLLAKAAWRYALASRGSGKRGFMRALEQLAQAVPTGVFSSEPLRRYLSHLFSQPGRSDDFRRLSARLYLIATDLDSGQAVKFGASGHDAVPISLAATASSALPGLFPPVEIDGRHYVDGALKRTLHASVALDEGAGLVLCLNPLVPYDDSAVTRGGVRPRRLVEGGLPFVLLQTIRSVIRSRMEIGMRQYADDYPDADVLLFEPDRADAAMFFTNMFSYSSRRRMCEHAYQTTRADLWRRRHVLEPILARHGIWLELGVLRDKSRTLIGNAALPPIRRVVPMTAIADGLGECLDDLDRYLAHQTTSATVPRANRPRRTPA